MCMDDMNVDQGMMKRYGRYLRGQQGRDIAGSNTSMTGQGIYGAQRLNRTNQIRENYANTYRDYVLGAEQAAAKARNDRMWQLATTLGQGLGPMAGEWAFGKKETPRNPNLMSMAWLLGKDPDKMPIEMTGWEPPTTGVMGKEGSFDWNRFYPSLLPANWGNWGNPKWGQ